MKRYKENNTTQNNKKPGVQFGERDVQCGETGLGVINTETIFKTCFHMWLLKLDVQAEKKVGALGEKIAQHTVQVLETR